MKTRYIFLKRGFFALLISFLLLAACKKETKLKRDRSEQPSLNEPTYTFKGIRSLASEDADLRLILTAAKQLRYEDGDEYFPDGMYIEVFDSLGKVMTTVKADSGIYKTEEKIYRIMGNVVVERLDAKRKLETPELNWDKENRLIYTDSVVKITEELYILNGKGLKSNETFSEYEILEPYGTAFTSN